MQKLLFLSLFTFRLSTQMLAASKLAPLFDALAKDKSEAGHDGSHAGRDQFYRATTKEFLDRLTPSEEIPAFVVALESGNPVVRNMGVRMALTIMNSHKADDAYNAPFLQPPLPELIKQFKVLGPIVARHFNDADADVVRADPNVAESWRTTWKTEAIQFVDSIGFTPSPNMITWMLTTQTPFEVVAPLLAHVNPMPPDVKAKLMSVIDDAKDRDPSSSLAASIINAMGANKSLGLDNDIVGRLKRIALDKTAPAPMRSAAVFTVGSIKPTILPEMKELMFDEDSDVRFTAAAVGLRKRGIRDKVEFDRMEASMNAEKHAAQKARANVTH